MEIPTTIDEFKMWKVERLKQFLKKRNLKVSGRKDELVALAYAAVHMNIPQVTDAREEKATDYSAILNVENEVLPDPFKDLENGWEGEDSVRKWPPCMYFDIAQYLSNIDNVELCQRLMSDYKEGKAYSYLESGWLGEMFYHVINEKSKFCLLKAECRPSQRINNIPWQAWICLEKLTGRSFVDIAPVLLGLDLPATILELCSSRWTWPGGLESPSSLSQKNSAHGTGMVQRKYRTWLGVNLISQNMVYSHLSTLWSDNSSTPLTNGTSCQIWID
ncbi:hypothetical protein BSL78_02049 [Apostichopus japonicus]|uniref:SAP domain-containing protein n=1 Tax=Stichopus japonicus TaxID=307972 RepID=A0A2G8LL54_STIJA|nr:hypothetical protein BSL78_02049 [Apostichopus japonicus]